MSTCLNSCKAIIFDVDDLLLRSEELCTRAMINALAEEGIRLTPEEYVEHWIIQKKDTMEFVQKYNYPLDPLEMRKKYTQALVRLAPEVRWMPGGEWIVRRFYGKKMMGVGTGNTRRAAEAFLTARGVVELFSVLVAVEDVQYRKPHPETFLKVADLLGVDPTECVVLEDALSGVLAGKRANMKVIAIPGPNSLTHDFL